MVDEYCVEQGLFAHRCIGPARSGLRAWATIKDTAKMGLSVKANDLVVADAVIEEKSISGSESVNGPFLHLTNCSGWLFERKIGNAELTPVPIESGSWRLQVVNDAIALRAQPIDGEMKLETVYEKAAVVECDKRIASPANGVCFYRVKGTDGWVFDKRGAYDMMKLLSTSPASRVASFQLTSTSKVGWSPDFVRGAAAAVDGIKEISCNEESRLISFRSREGARVNVYYTTPNSRHCTGTSSTRKDTAVSTRL